MTRYRCAESLEVSSEALRLLLAEHSHLLEEGHGEISCELQDHSPDEAHWTNLLILGTGHQGSIWGYWSSAGGGLHVQILDFCSAMGTGSQPCDLFPAHSGAHSWELEERTPGTRLQRIRRDFNLVQNLVRQTLGVAERCPHALYFGPASVEACKDVAPEENRGTQWIRGLHRCQLATHPSNELHWVLAEAEMTLGESEVWHGWDRGGQRNTVLRSGCSYKDPRYGPCLLFDRHGGLHSPHFRDSAEEQLRLRIFGPDAPLPFRGEPGE